VTVTAKICGLNDPLAMDAAVDGGASHIGLQFYAPSPRVVTMDEARQLARAVPPGICKVGVFVDADDALIDAALDSAALDLLQLHGAETSERVAALKARTGCAVMKVIPIASDNDLAAAKPYYGAADWLLFDAKPPKDIENALPGGNARPFDWRLLSGHEWPLPWMLAGGLNAANVSEAVTLTGASVVDCSSGVEDRPGCKNPAQIRAFLAAVAAL
jgi:phosphoribosylanthranilate isomerase